MLRFVQQAHVSLSNLRSDVRAFAGDESGATAIEYGLIAAGISIAVITTVFTLGGDINQTFSDVSTKISGAAP